MNETIAKVGLIALILVAVPLAGCVGGQGGSATGDAADTADGVANESEQNASDAGDTAHVHDRWFTPDGEPTDQVTLVDRTVTLDPVNPDNEKAARQCSQPPAQGGPTVCLGRKTFYPETGDDGSGKIVPPGTKNIDVTLEWDGAIDQIRFSYQDALSNGQWNALGTFESGDTMTISSIPVAKADDGHAQVSAWKFHIEPKGNTYAAGDQIWYGEGDVDVEIQAHRVDGDLPVEPPHPDFWEDTDIYRIGHVAGSASSFTHAGPVHTEGDTCGIGSGPACTPVEANSDGLFWSIQPGYEGKRLASADKPPELTGEHDRALVPPATVQIAAKLVVDGQAQQPVDVCLRTMTSPEEGPYGVVAECMTYDGGNQEMTVTRAIGQRLVDSYYTDNTGQNTSRWSFVVQISAPDAGQTNAVGQFDGSIEASIFAAKTDSFEVPSWAAIGGGGA